MHVGTYWKRLSIKLSLMKSNKLLGQLPTPRLPNLWSAFTPNILAANLIADAYSIIIFSGFIRGVSNLFYRYWRWFIGDALVLAVAPVGVPNWVTTSHRNTGQNHCTRGKMWKKSHALAILIFATRRFGAQMQQVDAPCALCWQCTYLYNKSHCCIACIMLTNSIICI